MSNYLTNLRKGKPENCMYGMDELSEIIFGLAYIFWENMGPIGFTLFYLEKSILWILCVCVL